MKLLGNAILEVINQPEKKEKRLAAIDETVIKLEDEHNLGMSSYRRRY